MSDRVLDETHQAEQLLSCPAQPHPARVRRDPRTARPVPDDGPPTLTCAVSVRREGPRAWIRVTGQLNTLTRRHLDDWLDWLITTGAGQVSVSLVTAEQIDEASLLILRMAQSRLRGSDGELLVTAGRAPVRAAVTSTNR